MLHPDSPRTTRYLEDAGPVTEHLVGLAKICEDIVHHQAAGSCREMEQLSRYLRYRVAITHVDMAFTIRYNGD